MPVINSPPPAQEVAIPLATSEGQIVDYVNGRVDRLESSMNQRFDKQETILDDIRRGLVDHLTGTGGHPQVDERFKAVEEKVDRLEKRPMQTWQLVVGVVLGLISICGFGMSSIYFIVFLAQHLNILK